MRWWKRKDPDPEWRAINAQLEKARSERKSRVAPYAVLVVDVNECLYRADPIGLAAAGCPPDEYEAEAESIVIRLPEASTSDQLLEVVHDEFQKWFGADVAGSRATYEELSRAIWALWQSRADR